MIKKINYEMTYDIRHQVMWPDKPLAYIKVDGDASADHYGYFVEGELVAVISVFKTGESFQFRKFATLKDFQHRGIGSMLLKHILSLYDGDIWCNARVEKTAFYEKFGLLKTTDTFTKGGKEYIIMKKARLS